MSEYDQVKISKLVLKGDKKKYVFRCFPLISVYLSIN